MIAILAALTQPLLSSGSTCKWNADIKEFAGDDSVFLSSEIARFDSNERVIALYNR
jgi:hypothetical protein